jgi:hypothetical protein
LWLVSCGIELVPIELVPDVEVNRAVIVGSPRSATRALADWTHGVTWAIGEPDSG